MLIRLLHPHLCIHAEVLEMLREMKPQLYALLTHRQHESLVKLDELSSCCSRCGADVEYYSDDSRAYQ